MENQKRGRNVALMGATWQLVVSIGALILWNQTDSRTIMTGLWLLLGGIPLWLITAVLFYARQLAAQEKLELAELAGAEETTLFHGGEEGERPPAERRVAFLDRWVVPTFSLLYAGYHLALAALMINWLRIAPADSTVASAPVAAVFLLIPAFVSFLLSMYCTGMARREQWSPLRAPGSYLLINALGLAVMLAAIAGALLQSMAVDRALAWVFPVLGVIYGGETALNFVLNIYRPRMPGREHRLSYDSRLFNLLADPGRVGSSIADTLNYQFGFEVSSTWFYQLVSKAMTPLVVFAVLVMLAASSLAIVEPGQKGVHKHWGRVVGELDPGLHITWPWPVDTVERFNVDTTHEIMIGLKESEKGELMIARTREGRELMVWAEEHGYMGQEERETLMPIPTQTREVARAMGEAASLEGVTLVKLVVVIQYQIESPLKYGYSYTDPEKLIRLVAGEEITQYAAKTTLEETADIGGQGLMTLGRDKAADDLLALIQKRLGESELDLGVTITYVGIPSAHPPAGAVESYEQVLQAERLQDKQRYEAMGQAYETLAEVAGDPDKAMDLYLALHAQETFGQLDEIKSIEPATYERQLDGYLREANGQIQALEDELQRERLFGRKEVDLAPRARLLADYKTFAAELQAARKDRGTYDYKAQQAKLDEQIERLYLGLAGSPAVRRAEAEGYRWQKEFKARTDLLAYQRKLLPYLAAKDVYTQDRRMDVFDEMLPKMGRVLVLGVDPDAVQIWMNLEAEGNVIETGLEQPSGGQ